MSSPDLESVGENDDGSGNGKSDDRSFSDKIWSKPKTKLGYLCDKTKIIADLLEPCKCSKECGQSLLPIEKICQKIQHTRATIFSMKQGDARSTHILHLFRQSRLPDGRHLYEGVKICGTKWQHITSISRSLYYTFLQRLKGNVFQVVSIKKPRHTGIKGNQVRGFLQNAIQKYGDYSPEREKILLPPCITLKFLLDEYMEQPYERVKKRQFYKIFQKDFSKQVSFAKFNNINPCDICMLASQKLQEVSDQQNRLAIKADLNIHLQRQSGERNSYYKRREEAITSPRDVCSVIVDGMDQSKTNLPHFRGWTKPKSGGSVFLKTHITGVIIHGKGNRFFIDLCQWPHDPNLMATCLLHSLRDHVSDIDRALPPKLYVQCDNCGRENKNKFILGLLGYLCLAGYVREVQLSFLIKGHTHEDIDQRFSTISKKLKRTHAKSLPELEDLIASAQSSSKAASLGVVWDVRSWIAPYLDDITNHSYPHQFRFVSDKPGHVSFHWKMWSTEPEWRPMADEEQLDLFLPNDDGTSNFPTDFPDMVEASFDDSAIQQLRTGIEKLRSYFTYDQYQWWQAFLASPSSVGKRLRFPLQHIRPLHKVLAIPLAPSADVGQSAELKQLLETEERCPGIRVGKKTKQNRKK